MRRSRTSAEPTTLAAYTEAITRALEAVGVDPVEILREADVERVRSNDPLLRVTDSDINAIYERATAATGHPYSGLRVADHILPGMLHALGYALLASETLEDFCNRMVRYWGLIAESADFSVREEDGLLRFEGVPRNAALCFETEDTFMALVLRLMRMVYHGRLEPERVALRRPVPAAGDGSITVTDTGLWTFLDLNYRLSAGEPSSPQPRKVLVAQIDPANGEVLGRFESPDTSGAFVVPDAQGNLYLTLSATSTSIAVYGVNPQLPSLLRTGLRPVAGPVALRYLKGE